VTTEIELLWLDERETVTLSELARACGLTQDELHELVEYGAVAPVESRQAQPVFSAASVPGMRAAGKLRRDFDLDLFAVAMLVEYLDRIENLERRIASLEAQLPRPSYRGSL
jgi:chaperone modulatory protein CbpM